MRNYLAFHLNLKNSFLKNIRVRPLTLTLDYKNSTISMFVYTLSEHHHPLN